VLEDEPPHVHELVLRSGKERKGKKESTGQQNRVRDPSLKLRGATRHARRFEKSISTGVAGGDTVLARTTDVAPDPSTHLIYVGLGPLQQPPAWRHEAEGVLVLVRLRPAAATHALVPAVATAVPGSAVGAVPVADPSSVVPVPVPELLRRGVGGGGMVLPLCSRR